MNRRANCSEDLFKAVGARNVLLAAMLSGVLSANPPFLSSQTKIELAIQTGHTGGIVDIQWSPNGKYVATLGGEGDVSLKIWEVERGRTLADLKPAKLNCYAWSPNGNLIALGRQDNAASIWDSRSGKYIAELKHPSEVSEISWSPDGRYLATLTGSGVVLWDVERWQYIAEMDANRGARGSIKWSPDGRYLITSSIVWEVPSGTALARLPGYQGHPMGWDPANWSPRGDLFAAVNGRSLKIWETANWQQVAERSHSERIRAIAWSPDGNHIAAASDIGLVWRIDRKGSAAISETPIALKGHSPLVYTIAWSKDAKVLATGGNDATVKLWRPSDWSGISSLKGHVQDIQAMAFSPVESLLATASADSTGKIWDTETGSLVSDLKARTHAQCAASFSPNGKNIAIGGYDSPAKIWDTQSGQIIYSLSAEKRMDPVLKEMWKIPAIAGMIKRPIATSTVRALSWSPSSRQVAVLTSNGEGVVEVWDVNGGLRKTSFQVGMKFVQAVAWSPDGKYIATGGSTTEQGEAATRIWQAETGRLYTQMDYQREQEKSVVVSSIAWSPDARYLARGGANVSAGLIDINNGQLVAPFIQSYSVAWSLRGHLAIETFAQGERKIIRVWDSGENRFLKEIDFEAQINSVAWSPDSNYLAVASESRIIIIDAGGGAKAATLEGHAASISEVQWSPDGNFIITASADATVKIWNASTAMVLATMLTIGEGKDWIITTPDGLFDGSAAAWQLVGWHTDATNYLDVSPVEVFFREFFFPDLLPSILSGKQPRAPRSLTQAERRLPRIKLSALSVQLPGPVNSRTIKVRIELSEAQPNKATRTGSGAQDVKLFRNGSLVKYWRGDLALTNGTASLEASIPIVAGENRLTAYAFNRDNVKSTDATLIVNGADSLRRKGTAYIVCVGINQYANVNYSLRYAVADAQAFSEEIEHQQKMLDNFASIEVIPLFDQEATKANILGALKRLSGTELETMSSSAVSALKKLKPAQPEDAVFVYFAGHGAAAGSHFYLIPYDLGYPGGRNAIDAEVLKTILAHSISDLELEQAFEKVDAGRLLLVIDACNSGQALEAEEKRRGPMNSKGLAQLAYEKGMYILTAAQSYQAAQEVAELGHGLLTYALVEEGLKTPSADTAPNDGQVVLREWLDYATLRVPQIQESMMQEARKVGREVAFVDGEIQIQELGKRSLQRPRVFYRREPESEPLVVAKPPTKR